MALPHFTLKQLDACAAVAELSSFNKAAGRLHLSTSAVSALVSELEAALGFALFERTTRRVALTRGGREFLPSALAVRRQIALARSAAGDIRDHAKEIIRVAAPMGLAATLLPPLIAEFQLNQPSVLVQIVDTAVELLGDRVSIGEAHVAVGPLRSVHADLVVTPLFESPWVIWCAPSHPLVDQPLVAWTDLAALRLVAAGRDHEETLAPQLAAAFCDGAVSPKIEVVDNLTTAFALTAADLAVTFSPTYVEALALRFGLARKVIADTQTQRRMALYRPSTKRTSALIQVFCDHLIAGLRDPEQPIDPSGRASATTAWHDCASRAP